MGDFVIKNAPMNGRNMVSKEFKDYIKTALPDWYDDFSEHGFKHTVDYVNKLQAKIDEQAKEIECLRRFTIDCLDLYPDFYREVIITEFGLKGID